MIQCYSREGNSDRALVGKALENCVRAIIGVLLNLTHDNGSYPHNHDTAPLSVATCYHVCLCRVGQHQDGRAGRPNSDGSELRPQSPSVPSAGAEVRHPSTGEDTHYNANYSIA